MRRTFSYDGYGINGPDEHRTRLATFTEAGKAYPGLGKLLEAAPELLEALECLAAMSVPEDNILDVEPGEYPDATLTDCMFTYGDIRKARTAIAKAKGGA